MNKEMSLVELKLIDYCKEFLLIQKDYRQALLSDGLSESEIDDEAFNFVMYWTEKSSDHPNAKMRWQKEKTFDVKRRLYTWFKNYKKWNKKSNSTTIKI